MGTRVWQQDTYLRLSRLLLRRRRGDRLRLLLRKKNDTISENPTPYSIQYTNIWWEP